MKLVFASCMDATRDGTQAVWDHVREHTRTVRHALLCAPQVDLPALASAGHLRPSTPGTWHVR